MYECNSLWTRIEIRDHRLLPTALFTTIVYYPTYFNVPLYPLDQQILLEMRTEMLETRKREVDRGSGKGEAKFWRDDGQHTEYARLEAFGDLMTTRPADPTTVDSGKAISAGGAE